MNLWPQTAFGYTQRFLTKVKVSNYFIWAMSPSVFHVNSTTLMFSHFLFLAYVLYAYIKQH